MPGFGNFKVGDCYEQIAANLAGKSISNTDMNNAIYRTILELSGTYPFQGLQNTGPYVFLTPQQNVYAPTVFMQPSDAAEDLRTINSFFMYYTPGISNPPTLSTTGAANQGVQLTYRSINTLENSINILSIPNYWSRHAGQVYIAPTPQYAYLTYMRYQKEHPFSTPVAQTDTIFLDDDWQDIVEINSAYRLAIQTRLLDYATSPNFIW